MDIVAWKQNKAIELCAEIGESYYEVVFSCIRNLDDREDFIASIIRKLAKVNIEVTYSHIDATVSFNGRAVKLKDLSNERYEDQKVLVDATSLSAPQLLHLLYIFKLNEYSFDVLYIEPDDYTRKKSKSVDSVEQPSFDLSDDGIGAQLLPPFVGSTANSRLIINLGFEGHRLGSLLTSGEYSLGDTTCLLGVPAFKASWENRTLKENSSVIERSELPLQFKFSGANDPIETYKKITEAYGAAKYDGKSVCLAPFGTKPMSLAAIWFAVNHLGDCLVLHDFVEKKVKRSSGKGTAHLWTFMPNMKK